MSVTSALAAGRAAAEARMTSTCRVVAGGSRTWDAEAKDYVVSGGSPVYEGPCRVKAPTLSPSEADAGDREVLIRTREVHVPIGTTGIREGHTLTVLVSPVEDVAGLTMTVFDDGRGDQTTALRLVCREVS